MKLVSSKKICTLVFMALLPMTSCSEKKAPEEPVAPEQPVTDLPAAPAAPVAPEAPISLEGEGDAKAAPKATKKSAKKKGKKSLVQKSQTN